MANLKRCGVAMAALLVSSLPALAQDDRMAASETHDGMMHTMDGGEESGDMAGNGSVTFELDGDEVRLPIGIAAQVCETTASSPTAHATGSRARSLRRKLARSTSRASPATACPTKMTTA